ncbi:MAG: Clp1/GlmU family protein [Nitrososphaeria archaeon]|nr:Clp1/GlmU family protein [Nitrososphaeria archaeon]
MLSEEVITVDTNTTLLVQGPAEIEVLKNFVEILGVKLFPSERICIKRNRIVPVESKDKALVSVIVSDGGKYWLSDFECGVKIWSSEVEKVFDKFSLEAKPLQIMIVGETDSGKSTLSTYLANYALSKGLKPCILDCDLGQGDLAPPGCIGLKLVEKNFFDLRELAADYYEFIGIISPRGFEEHIIDSIIRLKSVASERSADILIVNTDGYVKDKGLDYKVNSILKFKPDIVLCLEDENNLNNSNLSKTISSVYSGKVISLKRAKVKQKSRDERFYRRLNQYRRFLRKGKLRLFNLFNLNVKFLNKNFYANRGSFFGNYSICKLNDTGFNLIVRPLDLQCILCDLKNNEIIFSSYALNRMFVALGYKGKTKGFGLITQVNPEMTLTVLTQVNDEIDTIHLSTIKLMNNLNNEVILPILKQGFHEEVV